MHYTLSLVASTRPCTLSKQLICCCALKPLTPMLLSSRRHGQQLARLLPHAVQNGAAGSSGSGPVTPSPALQAVVSQLVRCALLEGVSFRVLGDALGLPKEEAGQLLGSFFVTFPGLEQHRGVLVAQSRQKG